MTYREIIFMIKDLLKINSNESYFEEEHIIYLANQHRMMLLKQRYSDIRRTIPDINFQTIKVDMLELQDGSTVFRPTDGNYLVSMVPIPSIISINSVPSTTTRIRGGDVANTMLTFVTFDRLRYTGHNQWLQNIIYSALGPGAETGLLYAKSGATLTSSTLPSVFITSIFENPLDAYAIDGFAQNRRDLDYIFPLESPLVPNLIKLVLQDLLGASYRPIDSQNNSEDDLSDMMQFIRQNLKSPLTKAIEQ